MNTVLYVYICTYGYGDMHTCGYTSLHVQTGVCAQVCLCMRLLLSTCVSAAWVPMYTRAMVLGVFS